MPCSSSWPRTVVMARAPRRRWPSTTSSHPRPYTTSWRHSVSTVPLSVPSSLGTEIRWTALSLGFHPRHGRYMCQPRKISSTISNYFRCHIRPTSGIVTVATHGDKSAVTTVMGGARRAVLGAMGVAVGTAMESRTDAVLVGVMGVDGVAVVAGVVV